MVQEAEVCRSLLGLECARLRLRLAWARARAQRGFNGLGLGVALRLARGIGRGVSWARWIYRGRRAWRFVRGLRQGLWSIS
jgi:hypothetical protein